MLPTHAAVIAAAALAVFCAGQVSGGTHRLLTSSMREHPCMALIPTPTSGVIPTIYTPHTLHRHTVPRCMHDNHTQLRKPTLWRSRTIANSPSRMANSVWASTDQANPDPTKPTQIPPTPLLTTSIPHQTTQTNYLIRLLPHPLDGITNQQHLDGNSSPTCNSST